MTNAAKPTGAYRAYDVMTGAEIGRYESSAMAHFLNPGKPITVIYRPSRKKRK